MKRFSLGRAAVLFAGLLGIAASLGCEKAGIRFFIPNQRPTVELTAAPVSTADTAWYSYRMNWSGSDPDGRVERFEYVIDPPKPPGSDTVWISTVKNEQQLFFRATNAYFDPKHGWRSNELHTFVIRAIDNSGSPSTSISAPKSRSFFSYTIAPVVAITNPAPTALLSRLVTPAVRINWQGKDEDGVFSQKPVQYKYRLFKVGDAESDTVYAFEKAQRYPDSLRMFYAKLNFAGWDSVSGDTTFKQYTQLTPGAPHLFVVIGIDEAGAYSPDFSLESNMLKFTPGFAGTLGPKFTVFNEFFFYQYSTGGYSTDPLVWIKIEVPAGRPITFNWIAQPDEGASIEWYRWKLDGDVNDETPRTDENTDWYHWSRKNNLTSNCTVGPFAGREVRFLYIAARDNNGLTSLAVVQCTVVQPTFAKDVLIVDDTRLIPDNIPTSGPTMGIPRPYAGPWPAAAELDTFLFARGGVAWKGPQGVIGNLPLSKPGVFNGYAFDTLGTRKGYELASAGVPLSLLGQYKHLLWLTDITGATTTYDPVSLIDPISTLRWISGPGRANTLSTYVYAGGQVWLAGGTAATCTLLPYNAVSARNNDGKYGSSHAPVFSATAGELAPGRMMWDGAHWRSEMVVSKTQTIPRRSTAAVGGWRLPGWGFKDTLTAPDYSRLPANLRRRSLALGDSVPPTCLGNAARFTSTAVFPGVEYLTLDNMILEDFAQSPLFDSTRSALDTLYELQGGVLATSVSGRRPVTMTYYHGVEAPKFVFSGFDLWTWSRQDIVGLVDVVFQDIWGLRRAGTSPAALRPTANSSRPAPSPARPGLALPGGKSGSR